MRGAVSGLGGHWCGMYYVLFHVRVPFFFRCPVRAPSMTAARAVWLRLLLMALLPVASHPHTYAGHTVLSVFYGRHDAGLAAAAGGRILAAVHLERDDKRLRAAGGLQRALFCEPAHSCGRNVRQQVWERALQRLTEPLPEPVGRWDTLAYVGGDKADEKAAYFDLARSLVPHHQFRHVPHHVAHAHLAFYDSPFATAVVVTTDGGGDDGYFNVWWASRANRSITRLGRVDKDMGHAPLYP